MLRHVHSERTIMFLAICWYDKDLTYQVSLTKAREQADSLHAVAVVYISPNHIDRQSNSTP